MLLKGKSQLPHEVEGYMLYMDCSHYKLTHQNNMTTPSYQPLDYLRGHYDLNLDTLSPWSLT